MDPDYKNRPTANELLNHPFVCKFERKRRWKLRAKRTFNFAKSLVNWFIAFFVHLFVFICYPFKYLYKIIKNKYKNRTIGTPPHLNNSKYPTNDWDANYSDDDVFDASAVSVLDNSTLFDSSSHSDDRFTPLDNSFDTSK